MTPVQVRRAGLSDLTTLAALRESWKGQAADGRFTTDFTDWFGREAATRWWWIAESAGAAVGMVNLKVLDRMPSPDGPTTRWGYLCNLYVVPEHRGSGAGADLVNALLATARAEQLVRVVLHPSEPSVPLYRRLGFTSAHSLLIHELG